MNYKNFFELAASRKKFFKTGLFARLGMQHMLHLCKDNKLCGMMNADSNRLNQLKNK